MALQTVIFDILEQAYEDTARMVNNHSDYADEQKNAHNNLALQMKKYNKQTWALIKDIRKISKSRIESPKNIYNPIGKIRVSNEVLHLIDAEIAKCFLK